MLWVFINNKGLRHSKEDCLFSSMQKRTKERLNEEIKRKKKYVKSARQTKFKTINFSTQLLYGI